MFANELKLFAFVVEYAKMLTAELSEEQMRHVPAPGMNPPIWILGHITIAMDYALKMAGRGFLCPKEWHVDFGPGSKPLQNIPGLPTKAQLLGTLEKTRDALLESVPSISAEQMAQPSFLEQFRPLIDTQGHLLAHLLTTHPAIHLGQLSAWRRLVGLGPVLPL